MEELDEFGIPIKKTTKSTTAVDEFGIPIKKKVPATSTSKSTKLASEVPTGSSVGVAEKPSFKEGTLAWNHEKMLQSNPDYVAKYDKYTQAKTVTEENKQKALQELKSEKDNFEFTDYLKSGAKRVGTLAGSLLNEMAIKPVNQALTAFGKTTREDIDNNKGIIPLVEDTYKDKVPFEEQRKLIDKEVFNAKLEAKRAKKPIPKFTEEDKQKKAEDLFLKQRLASYSKTQVKDFMKDHKDDNLKTDLHRFEVGRYATLQEKDKTLLEEQNIQRTEIGVLVNKLQEKKLRFEKLNKAGAHIPENELNDFKIQSEKYQKIVKESIDTHTEYAKNRKDIGSSEENLDVFKRDYHFFKNFLGQIDATLGDLSAGAAGAINYGLEVKKNITGGQDAGDIYIQNLAKNVSNDLKLDSENKREGLMKSLNVDNINNLSDMTDYFAHTLIAQQLPNYGLLFATEGAIGVGTIGITSGGSKFQDMQGEVDRGEKQYSTSQMMLNPAGFAVTETASAMVDKMLLNQAGRVLASTTAPERTMIARSITKRFLYGAGDVLKQTGKGAITEGLDEAATQGFQNLIDDKPFMENIKDPFVAGAVLGGLIPGSTNLVSKLAKPFSLDNKIQKASSEILKLQSQLDNPNLSIETKATTQESLDKTKIKADELLKKQVKNIQNLTPEHFSEIKRLDIAQSNIKNKAQEIEFDDNLDDHIKKQILGNLKAEFSANNQRRLDLLERGHNVLLEQLDDKEVIRLKDLASRELMKEQNPDGTKSVTLNDEQISKKAAEIYNKEVESKKLKDAETESTVTETEPQAEVQKPSEEEKVDNVSLSDEENKKVIAKKFSDKNAEIITKRKEVNARKEETNSPTNGNIRIGDNSNLQQQEVEAVQPSDAVGESKGNVKRIKSLKEAEYDISFDDNGNVSKVNSVKDGREIPKFTEREVDDRDAKGRKQYKNGEVLKKKILVKNANYSRIEADALGYDTNNKTKVDKQKQIAEAIDTFQVTNEYDAALLALGTGAKVSLESIKSENGNKDATWATNQSSKTKLPSIDDLAHTIWDNNHNLDIQKIKNALIDIIGSHSSLDSVKNSIFDSSITNEKKLQEQEARAFLGTLSGKELAMYEDEMAEDAYLSELSENEILEYYENQQPRTDEQSIPRTEAENGLDVRESNKKPESDVKVSDESKKEKQPTEEGVNKPFSDVFNQDNIKEDLDWLDSFKLDMNNLNSTLPFLPQVFNALIDAIKVARMVGNTMQKAIEIARQELSKEFDTKEIDNAIRAFAEKANITLDKNKEKSKSESENEKDFKSESGKRSLIERLKSAKNGGIIQALTKELNSNYDVKNQNEVEQKAKAFIQKAGVYAAIEAVKNRQVSTEGGMEIAVLFYAKEKLAALIKQELKDNISEKDSKDLQDLYLETENLFAKIATQSGQQVSFINHILNGQEEVEYSFEKVVSRYKEMNGGEISAEKLAEFKKMQEELVALREQIKEQEELDSKQEAQDSLDSVIESETKNTTTSKTKREKAKLTKEALTKLQNRLKSRTYDATAGVPVAIINQGIEVIKKAIDANVEISEAIEKGIAKIKELYGKKWDKESDFRQDALEDFSEAIENEKKANNVTVTESGKIEISTGFLKNMVESGIKDIDDVVATIKKDLESEHPEVTDRQIRDAVTGYGRKSNKTKTQLQKDIIALKRIGKLESQLEDIQNGISKEKSPSKKRELSEQEKTLKNQIKQLEDDLGITESERTKRAENYTEKRIEEIREKIRNKDYSKKEPKPIEKSTKLKELTIAKNRIQEQYDTDVYLAELKNRSRTKKALNVLLEQIPSAIKNLMTTGEFSFIMIQGGKFIAQDLLSPSTYKNLAKEFRGTNAEQWKKNPVKTFKKVMSSAGSIDSVGKMALAMADSDFYENFQDSVKILDEYDEFVAVNLRVLGEDVKTQAKDEIYQGSLLSVAFNLPFDLMTEVDKGKKRTTIKGLFEKIRTGQVSDKNKKTIKDQANNANPFNIFERANTVFMNNIRIKLYMKGRAELMSQGKNYIDNKQDFKNLASVVNSVTGSGNLHEYLKTSVPALNAFMFSARLAASGANHTVYAIPYFIKLGEGSGFSLSSPKSMLHYKPTVAQKMFLGTMVKSIAFSASVGAMMLAKLNSGRDDDDEKAYIETDPRSSDFCKIVDGSVRHEFMANYDRKWIPLLAKTITGEQKIHGKIQKTGSGYGSDTNWDLITRFGTNFLAPVPGMGAKYEQGHEESVFNKETRKFETKTVITFGGVKEDVSIQAQLESNLQPMIFGTLRGILNDDEEMEKEMFIISAFFGYNTQNYDKKLKKSSAEKQ
ncbi:hypothetical protein [Flavobacterium psychrophilum]|uniref:Uncharacterized protein n=1 Tax=Flavobacterium psychrophilum TaxID=96345 RepID=A0A7U2NFE1_FLAPS|nr:hypothetical protein [Flavobacterium psychrophilum]QRE03522.1 hypothetical protein H0H26_11620 [Flavobacterium psychrophilum]